MGGACRAIGEHLIGEECNWRVDGEQIAACAETQPEQESIKVVVHRRQIMERPLTLCWWKIHPDCGRGRGGRGLNLDDITRFKISRRRASPLWQRQEKLGRSTELGFFAAFRFGLEAVHATRWEAISTFQTWIFSLVTSPDPSGTGSERSEMAATTAVTASGYVYNFLIAVGGG